MFLVCFIFSHAPIKRKSIQLQMKPNSWILIKYNTIFMINLFLLIIKEISGGSLPKIAFSLLLIPTIRFFKIQSLKHLQINGSNVKLIFFTRGIKNKKPESETSLTGGTGVSIRTFLGSKETFSGYVYEKSYGDMKGDIDQFLLTIQRGIDSNFYQIR